MPKSDGRLWALLAIEFRAAGADRSADGGADCSPAQIHARRAVAIVRRERATGKARTFGPGDEIPLDVARAYDLDGDAWERLGDEPNRRDMWRMPGFNPAEHEGDAQGCYVTPHLLDKYGPLTEIPPRKGGSRG
jgi:hypothetical protein